MTATSYEHALTWLGAFGVRIENTRLAHYRRRLGDDIAAESARSFAHQSDPLFINAVIEASDVIGIATLPTEAFSNNHEALTKLRDVRKGLEDAPAERIDRPRGYGFEFATAAMLHKAGAFGGFERYGDVMQTPGWHPWECKRVGSLTAVSARVREGRGQLKEARRRGISSGIIALDLTRPLRQEFPTLTAKTDARL